MAHGQARSCQPALCARPLGGEHCFGGAPDHRLGGGVDVGEDNVAVDRRDDLLGGLERPHHRDHQSGVVDRQVGHLVSASADRLEGGGERQALGGDERAVLAEAVAHHHVRRDAVLAQQAGESDVDGEHRGLRDLGPLELRLGLGHPLGRRRIDEDHVAQGTPQQRCHHLVGLGEGCGDGRLMLAEGAQHVGVLRALPGVEERHLAGRAVPAEDAAALEQLPRRTTALERVERLGRFVGQFGGVGVVDGDALRRRQRRCGRRFGRRCPAGGGVGLDRA